MVVLCRNDDSCIDTVYSGLTSGTIALSSASGYHTTVIMIILGVLSIASRTRTYHTLSSDFQIYVVSVYWTLYV